MVVREADQDWSGTIHGSSADRAVAALAADPVTMEELEVAAERFAKRDGGRRLFGNLSHGSCQEPYDAGLVVIDLVARLVVVDSTYSAPRREGSVEYHNGRSCTHTALRYHLADDWLFTRDGDQWEHLAERRRQERAATPDRDVREVFYGRPLLEFVGRGAFAAFARRDEIPASDPEQADSPFHDTIKQIHAAWMLTPRDDLGGLCPREVALDRHEHITWDLQDRCEAWSRLKECPPGLAESSHAFRYGGFGTHELVEYYELVRELLWSCWEQLTELAQSPRAEPFPGSFTVGDFLTTEVPRLAGVREAWLDEPDSEFQGRTPRWIIMRERARLPEGVSGHDAIVDPDCPCCQMMGEFSGPMFWHLDGSEMDDEFAFDTSCRTREEWENEQQKWADHHKRFNAEWSERERLGVTNAVPGNDGPWSRSFSVADTTDVPLGIRVFGVGCHLAELIVGLRAGADRESTPAEAQRTIDQLNRDFGNLRELLQSSDSSLAEALHRSGYWPLFRNARHGRNGPHRPRPAMRVAHERSPQAS